MKHWHMAAFGLAAILVATKLAEEEESTTQHVPIGDGSVDDYALQDLTQAGQCDPKAKPGVLLFRQWVINQHGQVKGAAENIVRDCSVGGPSEHWEGRGWDWFPPSKAIGDAFVEKLLANNHELARRAGIMNMIWYRRMWRAYQHAAGTRVWAPYSGASPHTDHVHFSFSRDGAMAKTSLYKMLSQGALIA